MALAARSEETPTSSRVQNQKEAEKLLDHSLSIITELENVLELETQLVRTGRIKEGLKQEQKKTELASLYMRNLEDVKSNAIALARFSPKQLENLKQAHKRFKDVVSLNQTIIATAKAISETLLKNLSDEMNKSLSNETYNALKTTSYNNSRCEPLLISKKM